MEFHAPLMEGGLFCGATLDHPVAGSFIMNSKVGSHLWEDASTRKNVVKAARVLKLHVLKQNARVASRFVGLSSTSMSMVFVLRKFPADLRALQITLPHSLGHPSEALFLRTSKGKKVLSADFGRGDMEVELLVKNAMAVVTSVRKFLDVHLVSEISLDADRLALPVWSRKLFDRGKRILPRKIAAPRQLHGKRTSMGPPALPPVKKFRAS